MRSSSLSVGASPVVPVTTSPSEPLSTRYRASARNASRSREPSDLNGVTIAVRTSPSKPRSMLLQQAVETHREPRRQLRKPLEREQDARHVRLARISVVADREQLAVAAEQHLLVRDEARETDGVDRRVAGQA